MGISISAQQGDGSSTSGGAVSIQAGNSGGGSGQGGAVTISAGQNSGTGTGNGGNIVLNAGNASGETGGDIQLSPGGGSTDGCVDFHSNFQTTPSATPSSITPINYASYLVIKVGGTKYKLALYDF
jgi:hypothetical protein